MWAKWFPWRFIVRRVARAQGFIDPISVISQLQRFAQPSEVAAPVELLRLAAVLQARGLMNSQAIQHNLDWVWPYWVVKQFDPHDTAFIPRAFSITHINLTHRNWTAVGLPSSSDYPIVDPRGLVTPFYDGWSIDAWIIPKDGSHLIPSKQSNCEQKLILDGNLAVETNFKLKDQALHLRTEMFHEEVNVCHLKVKGISTQNACLVVSIRPYNPEGVSFIHEIVKLANQKGWCVDQKSFVHLSEIPKHYTFSTYREGDVYHRLHTNSEEKVTCDVGMATAAALFELRPGVEKEIQISIPLKKHHEKVPSFQVPESAKLEWEKSVDGVCKIQIPDKRFQFLYDAAIKTIILHSPEDIYPGPFTYKHFWFRDAVVILYAMISGNLMERAESLLDSFPKKQKPNGYFRSQDGEWDSNGQVLWIMEQFSRMSAKPPKKEWKNAIIQAAKWIQKKRLPENSKELHAGLFPPGFSAEHLGPNDYYYWDHFWGVYGLRAASYLLKSLNEGELAEEFTREADRFLTSIERSLERVSKKLGHLAMPASPYRRMDAGAIGSIVVGYPLQLWPAEDPRLRATVDYLLHKCFVKGGFFHDVTHSGINPYLTLHVAQILLRRGDERYFGILDNLAELASPTGQWPEAVHPRNQGGCMGDGQHIWAVAEWILMMRNCFVREEGNELILCSGIPLHWLKKKEEISFGEAPTHFGTIHITLKPEAKHVVLNLKSKWHNEAPLIKVNFPNQKSVTLEKNKTIFTIPIEGLQ